MKFRLLISFICAYSAAALYAQDPEFREGFILHGRMQHGLITQFKSGTEPYAGSLQLIPQATIIPGLIRGGIIAGAFYTNQVLSGIAGPTVSVKIKTFYAGDFGSAANLHLSADHLWGTNDQRLLGGGIHLDLLNKITIGISSHRDYRLNNWLFQTALGFRLSKIRVIPEPFNQPTIL